MQLQIHRSDLNPWNCHFYDQIAHPTHHFDFLKGDVGRYEKFFLQHCWKQTLRLSFSAVWIKRGMPHHTYAARMHDVMYDPSDWLWLQPRGTPRWLARERREQSMHSNRTFIDTGLLYQWTDGSRCEIECWIDFNQLVDNAILLGNSFSMGILFPLNGWRAE